MTSLLVQKEVRFECMGVIFGKCFSFGTVWQIIRTYKGKFSCQINQPARYNNSCLELAILLKIRTNNPSWNLLVLESSVKPILGCHFGSQGLVWQKFQPRFGLAKGPRTTESGCKLNIWSDNDALDIRESCPTKVNPFSVHLELTDRAD